MPKLSPVSYKHLVQVFEADGFRCSREEGDHMVFAAFGGGFTWAGAYVTWAYDGAKVAGPRAN